MCPTCIEADEYTPREHFEAGGLSALVFCERNTHAGLEWAGAIRALAAVFALLVVAVAWRRRG